MMIRILRLVFIATCLLLIIVPVHAQRICEAIVENALETAEENCKDVEGGKACYGFDDLTPTFYDTVESNTLRLQGSSVDLPLVHTVQSTGFDAEEDEWGIGYFQISLEEFTGNTEETLRIIILGDVLLENAVDLDNDENVPFGIINFTAGERSDCQEAVNDVVVQAPGGVEVELIINDVPIVFGSSLVFGFANEDGLDQMYVTVLDGQAVIDGGTPTEVVIDQFQYSWVELADEQEVVYDPMTGEPVVDENGNPMMRRFGGLEFEAAEEISADGEGFRGEQYYTTIYNIPEGLLNYPIGEPPCECELDGQEQSDDETTCSPTLGEPRWVTFTNNSSYAIESVWLNFECQIEVYNTIEPGESLQQSTAPGHEWGFAQNGTVVAAFVIEEGVNTYSYP